MNSSSAALSETPSATLAPGMVVGRKYRIEAVLGSGAMGTVYRAQHLWLDAPIALKVLHPDLLNHEGVVARFLEEARAAACLHNEHVVRVLDTGRSREDVVFLALEYVTGRDLEYELRDLVTLPVETAVQYALDVCRALAEAHGRGIVHRDIKPENLLLDRGTGGRTRVKVADFGVAKRLYSKRDRSLTAASSPVGTPSYMAPEQILNAADVDGRADIFSLGVVLYEMLTGYLPFGGGSTGETYAATLREDPTPPRVLRAEIPEGLENIVLRCLEKRREDRFPDVGELALALAEYGSVLDRAQALEAERSLGATEVRWDDAEGPQGRPSTAPPVERVLPSEIPGLERRWPVWLAGAAVAALGLGLVGSAVGRGAFDGPGPDDKITLSSLQPMNLLGIQSPFARERASDAGGSRSSKPVEVRGAEDMVRRAELRAGGESTTAERSRVLAPEAPLDAKPVDQKGAESVTEAPAVEPPRPSVDSAPRSAAPASTQTSRRRAPVEPAVVELEDVELDAEADDAPVRGAASAETEVQGVGPRERVHGEGSVSDEAVRESTSGGGDALVAPRDLSGELVRGR